LKIWAIADLHLSFTTPNKGMEKFGTKWLQHYDIIKKHWIESIAEDDLVLIAGDISWAMRVSEAKADLDWIGELPGTKVLIRGNHDFWWESLKKIKTVLPESMHLIQNNAFHWNDISVGGARLWDSDEYSFSEFIDFSGPLNEVDQDKESQQKIFDRELIRLENSLKQLDPKAKSRIVMTHYPPIANSLAPSRAASLLEKYGVDICVFGHLHNIRKGLTLFGEKKRGVTYHLTACDYLDFKPIQIG
jgi:predicted phosphohydrolase